MFIKEVIFTIFKSLNPDSIKELIEGKLKDSLKYFSFLVLFALILASLLLLPKLVTFQKTIDEKFSKFDYFNISIKQKMNSPLILTENPFPKIVIDTTQDRNLTDEDLLITENKIIRKGLFKEETTEIESFSNILYNKDKIQKFVIYASIIMVPSLFVIAYLFYFIKFMLIILAAWAIAILILKLTKHKFKLARIFKIAVYSSTIMILLEMISMPFVRLRLIPLLIFLGIFGIAVWMNVEKEFVIKHKKEKSNFKI
jgi:hypothetical protein